MARGIGIALLLVVAAIVATEGSYMSWKYKKLGIKLSGHGIRYHHNYYGRKCGLTKLYGALRSCKKRYGSVSRCFPALYKKGYLGKPHVYKHYGKSHGLGVKFIKRGIVYHNRYYRFRHRRSHCMRYLTHCYRKYHKTGKCVHRLTSRGYIGKGRRYRGHKKSFKTGVYKYNVLGLKAKYYKLHGFKLHNRRFSYGGHAYRLRCGTTRFYNIWNRCYTKIHNVGRCFGLLKKHRLFYGYKGKGYGLTAKYLKYHGPRLHNRRFYYKKRAFSIKCSPTKWYGYWNACYSSKHSVGGCLSRLQKKHLFYLSKAKRYLNGIVYQQKKVAAYHVNAVKNAGYRHVKAMNTVANHHVKKINYVAQTHAATVSRLAKHHLNNLHSIIKNHLYKLNTQSKRHRYIKEKQHRRHLYQRKRQNKKHLIYNKIQMAKHKTYIAKAMYGLKARYLKFHGFNIIRGGFTYGGKGYRLDCSERHWYRYWSSCYAAYHDVPGCLYRLRKQNVVSYINVYEGGSEGYGDDESHYGEKGSGYAGELSTHASYGPEALYLKSHGLKLVGNMFNYHGKEFALTCSINQWYDYWVKYYAKYGSVSGCLKYLHSLQLFHHKGYNADLGYNHYLKGLEGTYSKFHGFKLSSDGIFNYGGKDYRLRCSAPHFYRYWNRCYGRYHSVQGCFNKLYKYHMFSLNAAKRYLEKTLYLQKKIAHNHVASIYKVSKAHVATMHKVANHHINNLQRTAHVHIAKVNSAVKTHLHRFHYIVKAHLNSLRKQTQKHLYAKETQHRRHQMERERQNRKHLVEKEIQNKKHKAYLGSTVYGLKATYLKFHGFPLHHGGFTYRGTGFHLSCSERRWYRYWNGCFQKYSSVSGCMGRLGKLGLLSQHDEGPGYYTDAGEQTSYGPEALYLKSHGIKLVDNAFNYHGKDYILTCSADKWYDYWNRYYPKYQSVSGVIKYLHSLQLFHHKGYDASAYIDYMNGLEGIYLKSHGFKLSSAGLFSYGGRDYRLRCSSAHFYRYWNRCYEGHPNVGFCFNKLRRYHLFTLTEAKHYLAQKIHLQKKIAYNHVASIYKVSKAHVATMNKVANHHINNLQRTAHVHVAKVHSAVKTHLHRFHYIVKAHLNSLRKQTQKHLYAKDAQHRRHQMERARQNKKHLLEKEIQNRKHKAYLANAVYGLKATYSKFHGFALHHGGFNYKGIGYHLSCSEKRWYKYWCSCYRKHSSVSGCVGRLGKLGLLTHHSSEAYGEGNGPGYDDYAEHEKGYDQYEDKGYGAVGYIGYIKGLENTYVKSHGFKLAGGIFNYHGKAFSLRCNTARFYGAWNKCYSRIHSVNGCFDELYKYHLFSLNKAGNILKKTINLHKKIAAQHVTSVHHVAKSHLAAMHKVAKGHLYNMNQVAHAHAATVAVKAKQHIHKFNTIIKAHLNKLRKHVKLHLHAKENQHRRHHAERENQNRQQLKEREILHIKHKKYLDYTINGLKSAYFKHHGFKLVNGGFTYHGNGYHLKCAENDWYKYWNTCYSKEESVSGCLGNLGKLGYITQIPAVVRKLPEFEEAFGKDNEAFGGDGNGMGYTEEDGDDGK